jgi:hypothetical protein
VEEEPLLIDCPLKLLRPILVGWKKDELLQESIQDSKFDLFVKDIDENSIDGIFLTRLAQRENHIEDNLEEMYH